LRRKVPLCAEDECGQLLSMIELDAAVRFGRHGSCAFMRVRQLFAEYLQMMAGSCI